MRHAAGLALLGCVVAACGGSRPGTPAASPAAAHSPADSPVTSDSATWAPQPGTAPAPGAAYQVGLATWYGGKLAGHRTASGERFDPAQMTAAHRTLPFGTWVEVTRADTGKSVVVRINDRGPFGDEARVIDLSRGAAAKIDLVRSGVTRVKLRVLEGR